MTTAESEYSIRARVDDGKQWPQALAERVYSDAFLSALTEYFGFDALDPNTARILRGMAASYIFSRRAENDPNPAKSERQRYLAGLQQAIQKDLPIYAIDLKAYEKAVSESRQPEIKLSGPFIDPDDAFVLALRDQAPRSPKKRCPNPNGQHLH